DAVEPYNELASALAARDGRGRSTLVLVAAGATVRVPVAVAQADSGSTPTYTYSGETDATVKGVNAHVVVDVRAAVTDGRLAGGTARNTFDARVLIRKIHVERTWSLTRV
ncbi:MAG TPA: hypothetical protein VGN14_16205, partial [Candidatus Elarobacter sp.]